MSFGFAAWVRVLQMAPFPFCFIAVTTAAYVGLPKEASNQVSGIINFARNVGGSIFIALTSALVTNRSLFHQTRLAHYHEPWKSDFYQSARALLSAYVDGVSSGQGAAAMARGQIYSQLNQQATVMGYEDVYRVLCWMAVGMMFSALSY